MQKPIVLKGLEFNFDSNHSECARQNNQLLMLDIDFSELCDLNCSYCDRYDDRKAKAKTKLSQNEMRRFFRQAKDLGCGTIEIPGVGEPMLDPLFWDHIADIHSLGMTTVLYTSAYSHAGSLITDETARRLKALSVSVVLKYESMDHSVQDSLVRRDGFSKIAEQALMSSLKAGLNTPGVTQLGIHTVVTKDNRNDVLDIFRFCRANNIFPYIVSSIPDGNALRMGSVVSRNDALAVLKELENIDLTENGIQYQAALPVTGGFSCRQIDVGMFINLYGDLYECNAGGVHLGNIREYGSLADAWNSDRLRSLRTKAQNGFCPVRERYWENISDTQDLSSLPLSKRGQVDEDQPCP